MPPVISEEHRLGNAACGCFEEVVSFALKQETIPSLAGNFSLGGPRLAAAAGRSPAQASRSFISDISPPPPSHACSAGDGSTMCTGACSMDDSGSDFDIRWGQYEESASVFAKGGINVICDRLDGLTQKVSAMEDDDKYYRSEILDAFISLQGKQRELEAAFSRIRKDADGNFQCDARYVTNFVAPCGNDAETDAEAMSTSGGIIGITSAPSSWPGTPAPASSPSTLSAVRSSLLQIRTALLDVKAIDFTPETPVKQVRCSPCSLEGSTMAAEFSIASPSATPLAATPLRAVVTELQDQMRSVLVEATGAVEELAARVSSMEANMPQEDVCETEAAVEEVAARLSLLEPLWTSAVEDSKFATAGIEALQLRVASLEQLNEDTCRARTYRPPSSALRLGRPATSSDHALDEFLDRPYPAAATESRARSASGRVRALLCGGNPAGVVEPRTLHQRRASSKT